MELRICVLLVEMLLALSIISSLELLSALLLVQSVSILMLITLIHVKLVTQIVLDVMFLQLIVLRIMDVLQIYSITMQPMVVYLFVLMEPMETLSLDSARIVPQDVLFATVQVLQSVLNVLQLA